VSHRIDVGLLLGGAVLPGTEWILRDSRAWFDPVADAVDVPARRHWPITQAVYHWTGGHCHVGPDAAMRVVRAMKGRLRGDGSPMSVSCHFVVSWDGLVFQVADLDRMAIHAGRVLNRDGIGVEQCWPGYESQAVRLGVRGGQTTARAADGHRVSVLRPAEQMIDASVRLANTLASLPPSTRVRIPRVVPRDTGRMRPGAAAAFRGVCEHVHSPGSTKEDCAGLVIDALAASGWSRGW
jgi:hypothetical protein